MEYGMTPSQTVRAEADAPENPCNGLLPHPEPPVRAARSRATPCGAPLRQAAPARDDGMPQGRRGCTPEGAALKSALELLYACPFFVWLVLMRSQKETSGVLPPAFSRGNSR
jgi:hypothetical protein